MLQGLAVGAARPAEVLRPLGRLGARIDLIAVAWLTAALVAVGLYRADGTTSLWTDELFSVTFASKPWGVIARQLWGENSNMGLYYVLLGGWIHALDAVGIHPTELLIRLPSIAFAVGAVLAAYFTASRLLGRTAGLVGAALLLLNYIFLMEIAQARAYGLELFLQLLGWYLLIRILESPAGSRRLAFAFGLVMALSVYADLFSVLVIGAQLVAFVTVAWIDRAIRARLGSLIQSAAVAGVTTALAIIPIAVDVVIHRAPNDWIPTPGLHTLVTFAGALSAANPLLALLLGLGCVLSVASFARRPSPAQAGALTPRTVVVLLLAWIVVVLVASYGFSHKPFNQHLFLTRYLLPIVPPICFLVAAGLYSLADRRVRAASIAATLLVALVALPLYYSRVQREDFRLASAWLTQRYQPGDGIACASLGCAFALEYYAPGRMQADSPGNYVWDPGQFGHVSVDQATLAVYAQAHGRVFLVYGTAGMSASIPDDESWLLSHGYTLSDKIVTLAGSAGPVTVELFERKEATPFSAGW